MAGQKKTKNNFLRNQMTKYYIQLGKDRKGPYDVHELMKQSVFSDTLVWHEGMEDWKPAAEIPALKPVIKEKNTTPINPVSFGKNKLFIIGGAVLTVIVIILIVSNNNRQEYSETVVLNPQIEKEIAQSSASKANPADDEIKRKQQQDVEIENNKRYIRNNWPTYFAVSGSDYTAEGLGGISNLRVYFENKTGYMLENVYAEIDIFTANGSVYKTEIIHFSNVQPNETQTYRVPYSPRGSSVSEPRITAIESALLNFCFHSESVIPGDSNDPFRCQ